MNKGKYKSVRNNNLKIKKTVKIVSKRTVDINEDSLTQALIDLDSGNLGAVKNFLRSLQGKDYRASKKTREILEEYSQELKIKATPAEKELMKIIPKEYWIDFSHYIILQGRDKCIARRPKCLECEIKMYCKHGEKV